MALEGVQIQQIGAQNSLQILKEIAAGNQSALGDVHGLVGSCHDHPVEGEDGNKRQRAQENIFKSACNGS